MIPTYDPKTGMTLREYLEALGNEDTVAQMEIWVIALIRMMGGAATLSYIEVSSAVSEHLNGGTKIFFQDHMNESRMILTLKKAVK